MINTAFAQDVGTISPSGGIMSFVPLVLVFVVFYFFLIRPQQRKLKQHQQMVSSLKRNDRVVTTGGLLGVVKKVEEGDILHIEIAPEVIVQVRQSMVSEVLARPGAENDLSAKKEILAGKPKKKKTEKAEKSE